MAKPDDLDRIANWPLNTPRDYAAMMTFVRGLFVGTVRWDRSEGRYELHATEDDADLIDSLQDNGPFWAQCWQSSNRHGVHVFCIPPV